LVLQYFSLETYKPNRKVNHLSKEQMGWILYKILPYFYFSTSPLFYKQTFSNFSTTFLAVQLLKRMTGAAHLLKANEILLTKPLTNQQYNQPIFRSKK